MPVVSCIPFPFSTPCDTMLTMIVCATRWLSMHLYMLAYMSMHESCLLMCRPCFNTMKLQAFGPNLQLSLADISFCSLSHLFTLLLVCLPCLSCLSALYFFICSLHFFLPLLACWFSCLSLCMYTHGARMHGARIRSPRRKQKGRKHKHVDTTQAAMFSRFRSLVFLFGYVLF